MRWRALLTEDEKIQTGVVIATPLGSPRAELGKGESAEPPGLGAALCSQRLGYAGASQVASGPERHLFGNVGCWHGNHKAWISRRGPDF